MPLSITKALDLIYAKTPVISSELLPIEMALGRILSEACVATFNLPRFDNSAMDGYAVKSTDAGKTVRCVDVIYAGDDPQMTLKDGEAIKIMTGAPIPKGCEAIIPIENVILKEDKVTLPTDISLGVNVRRTGEDIQRGTVYLQKGDKVTAYAIALLASQGITHLLVRRQIKVAVFGTGNELRPHFEKIESHQLYNSNTPMFLARAKELGCEVEYIGSSDDTLEALTEAIKAAKNADIIITSGGVSMGDKDFTKEAFSRLGMQIHFDKVDIKPGKPTVFGTLGDTVVINLPGNPLASMVNYELFVRAAIRKMSGMNAFYHGAFETKMKKDFALKSGKYTVRLGKFDGKTFEPFTKQLPGMLSPLEEADAMIIADPSVEKLTQGAIVKILPIKWELTSEEKEAIFTL